VVGYCPTGNMWFSRAAWQLTMDCFGERRECIATPFKRRIGGRWFCPADGQPMIENGGLISCRTCDRVMPDRLRYQLIELHAHGISDDEFHEMRRARAAAEAKGSGE